MVVIIAVTLFFVLPTAYLLLAAWQAQRQAPARPRPLTIWLEPGVPTTRDQRAMQAHYQRLLFVWAYQRRDIRYHALHDGIVCDERDVS